jgi:hypothetical protein
MGGCHRVCPCSHSGPVCRFAEQGDLEQIRSRVSRGGRLDSRDFNGNSSILAASRSNQTSVVKFILALASEFCQ